MVLTYGGGPPVVDAYRGFGAAACVPIYNALDPTTHFPVAPDQRFACDLAFLGNRLPDREARVEEFFLKPAAALPERRFLIGGNGWETKAMPANVRHRGHVYTAEHNAFNCTPKAVLNVARDSMAHVGFSPATRVFEAAGAAACLITDAWEGIEQFLKPDEEVLVARDGQDVAEHMAALTPDRAHADRPGGAAPVLADHTYASRCAGRCVAAGAHAARRREERHETRRPRPEPFLVVGERPRHHLPRAAQGVRRAGPRHPVPGAGGALVPHSAILPIPNTAR